MGGWETPHLGLIMNTEQAYKDGYNDVMEVGENLNPHDYDTDQELWDAYESGYTDGVNKLIMDCN